MNATAADRVIGVIINPIAGVGGRAGFKGSDTIAHIPDALGRGGVQNAHTLMQTVIDTIIPHADKVQFLTVAGHMGAAVLHGLDYRCVPVQGGDTALAKGVMTTAQHTVQACSQFWGKCDMVVFAGGDGTARDMMQTYDFKTPVLGVPAGVKMQSGVFATTAREAGLVLKHFIEGRVPSYMDCDVMDLDENALQHDILTPRYYGYMKVPHIPQYIQSAKCRPPQGDTVYIRAIANHMQSVLQSDNIYIVGAGKTTYSCLQHIGLQGSLLGVDVVHGGKLVLKDASIRDINTYCQNRTVAGIIVGCIGGQGIILGRGNQQIPPHIIRQVGKQNVIVVATPHKLSSLQNKPLRVDTGDRQLDRHFNGYITVINGFGHTSIYPVKNIV